MQYYPNENIMLKELQHYVSKYFQDLEVIFDTMGSLLMKIDVDPQNPVIYIDRSNIVLPISYLESGLAHELGHFKHGLRSEIGMTRYESEYFADTEAVISFGANIQNLKNLLILLYNETNKQLGHFYDTEYEEHPSFLDRLINLEILERHLNNIKKL